MLRVVAAKGNPKARVVSVLDAPHPCIVRDRAGVVRVHGFRGAIGRIEHDGGGSVASHGAGRHDSAPVATADASSLHRRLQVTEPAREPREAITRPAVAEMRELPVHALARVAQVRQLPFHAPPSIAEGQRGYAVLVRFCVPRPITRAPAASNPRARAPRPPASRARLVVLGIGHEPGGELRQVVHQPQVAGVQVAFVHRPASRLRDRLGIVEHGAPQVRDIAVQIVHCGPAREVSWAVEPHRAGAKERLDVVAAVRAEAGPDQISGF